LVHRAQALFRSELLPEHVSGVLDFAATRAGQVAAEERLQHQNQRIALAALEFLLQDVRCDRPHLGNRNSHTCRPHCSTWNKNANSLSLLQDLWDYVNGSAAFLTRSEDKCPRRTKSIQFKQRVSFPLRLGACQSRAAATKPYSAYSTPPVPCWSR